MRTIGALASLLLLSSCGEQRQAADELTGSVWHCVSFEMLGEKKEGFDAELRFIRGGKEGRFSLFGPQLGTYEFAYTRDDGPDPHHMDLVDSEDTVVLAIYSMTADTMKLCYSMTDVERRPKDFSSTAEGGEYSFVFRRRE